MRGFREERAAAAHRVVEGRAGVPAGQTQDACREVFTKWRRALVQTPAALEERIAGGVEIERAFVGGEECEDAHVRMCGVDVGREPLSSRRRSQIGVLDAQRREFEAAQRRFDRGDVYPHRLVRREPLLPSLFERELVDVLFAAIRAMRDFQQDAAREARVQVGGHAGGPAAAEMRIRHWREVGGNAVVFDIKDSDGSVNIPFEHPLLGQHKVYIHDLPKFVHFLHSENMHAIARIAIFRDERMVIEHPELAVKSKKTGQPWRENGKLVWTDSSNPKVQDYNIALAKFVAQSGADEIQFDYVRFPAEGDQKDASFVFQTENPKWQRSDVIVSFLKKAYAELHPTGVLLSLDVFGVMAWQRQVDLSHTGQDIVGMAKYCDVLSPMIYPSHFFGMDNIEHPGDAPEHFIGESMQRFELITHLTEISPAAW